MLGTHRALVVHGLDGLDEITITGPTRIAEVRDGNVRTYEVTPEEFGIKRARLEDISGGDAAANAAIIREILAGKSLRAGISSCLTRPPPWSQPAEPNTWVTHCPWLGSPSIPARQPPG